MKTVFNVIFLLILFSNKAQAYIDPGTGGILLQFIIAIIAGIASFWLIIKNKIISFFKKKNQKKIEEVEGNKEEDKGNK